MIASLLFLGAYSWQVIDRLFLAPFSVFGGF